MAELEHGMSNAEYLHWQVYYARRAQDIELAQLKAKGGGGG